MPFVFILLLVTAPLSAKCPPELLKKILQTRLEERLRAKDLLENYEERWPADGLKETTEERYQEKFQGFLPDDSFSSWVEKRKNSGKRTNVLDVFGSGVFLKPTSSLDSVTGLRLKDIQIPNVPPEIESKRTVIEGDINNSSTWRKISQHLSDKIKGKFDLVVFNPGGGMPILSKEAYKSIPGTEEKIIDYDSPAYIAYANLLLTNLNKLYEVTSEQEGELMLVVPSTVFLNPRFQNYLDQLGTQGLTVQKNEIAIKIVKTPEAIQKLPPW